MFPLSCGVQNYAWGQIGAQSSIFSLTKQTDTTKPYAELWMGSHPNLPSQPLTDYIKENPQKYLGKPCIDKFGDKTLPYLFKVLSIKKALSIQAHPNKKLAEKLFREKPEVYKDPNYKPEMAITLTDFEALSNFASYEEVSYFLQHIDTFRSIFTPNSLQEYHQTKNLKVLINQLFFIPNLEETIPQLLQEISQKTENLRQKLVSRLNTDFPNDIGILCQYFLNYITLSPYQCLSMNPDEPHAYISGDCIECMANSDNVVRLGLTPKLRDQETLMQMLDFKSKAPSLVEPKKLTENQVLYYSGYEEFQCIKVAGEFSCEKIKLASPGILIVVQGNGKISHKEQEMEVSQGTILYIQPGEEVSIKETKEFIAFVCSTKE